MSRKTPARYSYLGENQPTGSLGNDKYSDYGPIALYGRGDGSHSLRKVIPTIIERAKHIDDDIKQSRAVLALMSRTLLQDQYNNESWSNSGLVFEELSPNDRQIVLGGSPADRYVEFLHRHELDSIEDGRLIHPGDWSVSDFDRSIRESLFDPVNNLDTVKTTEEEAKAIYTIAQVEIDTTTRSVGTVLERKRVICHHFGHLATTSVRETLLVDKTEATFRSPATRELRKVISRAHDATRSKKGYNYKTRYTSENSPEMYEILESVIREKNIDAKPVWLVPLMSTYFTKRRVQEAAGS